MTPAINAVKKAKIPYQVHQYPFGQKKRLPTVLDSSATSFSTIFVSAGRRGLEIEISPDDLVQLTSGLLAEIAG